ncbi:unnamed protein product [Symbiodinium sp. CCMP2592]|nr:unnamed protein product [Symbiodinium sp. CCMP2592]
MRDSRSSSYVIREAILKFYDDKKLWPRGITSAMECIQVLDRLPSALAPAPVPLITQQYAKAIKPLADEADDDDEDDEEAVASEASELNDGEDESNTPPTKSAGYRFKVEFAIKKGSKRKAKSNPKTKRTKPEKAKADPEDHCYGDYLPKDFCDRGKAFRNQAKSEGHRPKVALRMWMESAERASILADLPLNELKKRRFVPKGCTENPFVLLRNDREFLELFAGQGNLSSALRRARLRGASVDILTEPVTMDLLTSRAVTGRNVFKPLGNQVHEFVLQGNVLSSRTALLVYLAQWLRLRWVIEQPDGSFLPEMPRFQKLFSTFENLIDVIVEKAGFMSKQQMSQFQRKTAVHHVDANGVKRHTGKPKELQQSQPLDANKSIPRKPQHNQSSYISTFPSAFAQGVYTGVRRVPGELFREGDAGRAQGFRV